MHTDREQFRLTGKSTVYRVSAPGLLGEVLAFAAGVVLLIAGIMFSLLILAAAAIVALVVLGYIWWNTRELRRRLRKRPPGGRVIDGEVIKDK